MLNYQRVPHCPRCFLTHSGWVTLQRLLGWNDQLELWRISTAKRNIKKKQMGVSENVVYPIVPNGFADHYPYEKWLFHWEY